MGSRDLAKLALCLAWFFPALAALAGPEGYPGWLFFLPSGSGLLDSNRTLLLLYCGIALLLSGRSFGGRRTPWLGLAFLGWCLLSSLTGAARIDSVLFSLGWFAAAAALVSIRSLQPGEWSPAHRGFLLHGLVLAVVVPSLYGLLVNPEVTTLAGPFQLPNVYANWQLMLLPLLLKDLWQDPRPWSWCSTTLALVCLVLTESRSTWILMAFAVTLTVLALESSTRKSWMFYGLGIGAVMLVLFFARSALGGVATMVLAALALLTPSVIEGYKGSYRGHLKLPALLVATCLVYAGILHMAGPKDLLEATGTRMNRLMIGDNSTHTRVELWKAAALITIEHPLTGVGPANFSEYYPAHQTYFYHYSDSPHSALLELSSELGLVGVALLAALALSWLFFNDLAKIWSDHTRRAATVGAFLGILEAQVDVSYQYPELWVTLALLVGLALGRYEHDEPKATTAPRWAALAVLVIGLSALTIYQRAYERTRLMSNQAAVYTQSREVAEAIPGWSKPILRALDAGLYMVSQNPEAPQTPQLLFDLGVLAQKGVKATRHHPRAYILAGRVALAQNKLPEAKALFDEALAIDPYNFPSAYQGALETAMKAQDKKTAGQLVERVLDLYQLDKLELAHVGHREALINQLIPLYFIMADFMNPFQQPLKTEPFLRFLVEQKAGPRALYGLGASLWAQGKQKEARPYFEEAHRANPMFPPAP